MKTHPHTSREPSLFEQRPVVTAVAVGALALVPHAFLTPQASLGYAAVVIALIAGVYFGFAVANGSPRDHVVELGVASLFAVAALLGLLQWPVLLPAAYFAHAVWDGAHHYRARLPLVSIPRWYVPWCVVVDVIVGAGLLVIWRSQGLM